MFFINKNNIWKEDKIIFFNYFWLTFFLEKLEKKQLEIANYIPPDFSDTLKFDPRNAYLIFLEMSKIEEKNKALQKVCLTCAKKKNLLVEFVFEIFKVDIFAEKESEYLSEMFESLVKQRDEIDIIGINDNLWKYSFSLRRALEKSQEILPHFAVYFERLFKIMLFFNEVIMNRLQQSITRMLYELEE